MGRIILCIYQGLAVPCQRQGSRVMERCLCASPNTLQETPFSPYLLLRPYHTSTFHYLFRSLHAQHFTPPLTATSSIKSRVLLLLAQFHSHRQEKDVKRASQDGHCSNLCSEIRGFHSHSPQLNLTKSELLPELN